MPNTPMLVGEGMVAMAPGARATPADMDDARRIFSPAATVIDVTEDKLDAVTALSGSGPAYFFYLVEQMIRAGEEMGMTPDESRLLAIRTAAGSAKMLANSPDSPQELRRKVTSPKGTTHEAITHMERAVRRSPEDPLLRSRLAELYHAGGRRRQAERSLELALAHTSDPEARQRLERLLAEWRSL